MPNREYWNNRRRERKQKCLDYLGGKCEVCGSTKNLHFDHKNPKKKEFLITDRLDAPENVLMKEVRKCRLLCDKCHRQKTRDRNEHGQPKAQHGKIWYYKKYKCRCPKCRKAMRDYLASKKKSSQIKELSSLFLKLAREDISVFTFVPQEALKSIEREGLLSAAKLIENPEALAAAFSDPEKREKKITEVKEKLKDPEWEKILRGVSAFFTLPHWSKIPPDHFISQNNLVPIEINLTQLLQDNPDTQILGVELLPEPDPDRERILSPEEIEKYTQKKPKELWKFYQGESDKYAPDVPHLIILKEKIPSKYLKL